MTPFQLLSYYANTAAFEDVLKENDPSAQTHYLMFMVKDEGFLIDIKEVDSVFRDQPAIKQLPFSPKWFRGLCSVRNEIVSVISFSSLYHTAKEAPKEKDAHYILLSGAMEGFLLEVEKLMGIRALAVDDIESANPLIDGEVAVDEIRWQRINLDALLFAKLHKKMEF